jgi:cell division control protein 6
MKLKPGESLFKDSDVFEPSYLPEDFLFRDSETAEMKACAGPALKGGRAANAFIFGRPATGKTTATRLVFSEIEKTTNRAICVHVNSHIYNSQYRILGEVHKKIFGFVPPETGMPVTALYDKIFSRLEKEKKSLIVALDDLNFYETKQANAVLYDLLRAHEVFSKAKISLWCISTGNELHRLDDKVRSTFVANTIEFSPYGKEEMKEILKARARAGLSESAISDPLLAAIAGTAIDLRHGIEILKKSAILAEGECSAKIGEKHVRAAIKNFEAPASSPLMDDEKIILDLLKKKARESGELYGDYKEITGASYATFYRTLKKLKERKAVSIEQIGKQKGRTSRIALKK